MSQQYNGVYSIDYRSNWLELVNLTINDFKMYKDCSFYDYDEQHMKICYGYTGPTLSVYAKICGNENFTNHCNYIGEFIDKKDNIYKTYIFRIPNTQINTYKLELKKYRNDIEQIKPLSNFSRIRYEGMDKFFADQKNGWVDSDSDPSEESGEE